MYVFQSESTLCSCPNLKELFPPSRRKIWRWSDSNRTRNQNHLLLKRTLNSLAKLTKWLSCVLSTHLYGALDCMFLSCHVHVSEWMQTLYLPECQGTPARIRREIWMWSDCNWTRTQNHLVLKWTLNHLAKLAKWLSCVLSTYLYGCTWLYVLVMSSTRFRVNPHFIVPWMSRNSLLQSGAKSEAEVTATELEPRIT